MPARDQVDNVIGEDYPLLPSTIRMGRKRLRGPLSADLVDSLRSAAASITNAGPSFMESSEIDSDDELLMDVEVRTSGPDSGLITNKSELKDDDDDDDTCNNNEEVKNHPQTDERFFTDGIDLVQNGNTNEASNASVTKIYTREKISLHSNENDHIKACAESPFCKTNGLISLSSTEITKAQAEFGIPGSKFIETTILNIDKTYSDTTGDLNQHSINDTGINPVSTGNVITFGKDRSHKIGMYDSHEKVECISPTQSSNLGLDNSSLSKLIETAMDIQPNGCAIVIKSVAPQSTNKSIKENCRTNGFNSGNFPRLKQMLTSGNISEATMHFNNVMSMDNPNTQGSNDLHTPRKGVDRLNSFVNQNQNSSHRDGQGTNEDIRTCFKRSRADDCNTICEQSAYLPPKKSKCFFTNLESLQYHKGVGISSIRAFDSPDEYKDENNHAETMCKPIACQSSSTRALDRQDNYKDENSYAENTYRPTPYQTAQNSFTLPVDSRDDHKDENSYAENTYKQTAYQSPGTGKRDSPACGPRPCSQRAPPLAPLLPPCRVCGEKASGFHYGVNTCEACKGFFRRSLCRKEPYVCVSDGACEVQSGRRTVCSHCRLKRCLDVGMSKNAIKTGRYTHELRSKNIMEVKQLQKQKERGTTARVPEPVLPQIKVPDCAVKPAVPCCPELNEELQDALDKLMTAQTYLFEFLDDYYDADLILKRQMEVYKVYGRFTISGKLDYTFSRLNRYKKEKFDRLRNRANNLSLNVERQSSPDGCVSRDHTDNDDVMSDAVKEQVLATMIEDMERGIQGMVMFAKNIPGFVDLDVDDQAALLKVSRFDIWYIGHIRCMNSPLRVGACEWYFHAEELEQVWGPTVVEMLFKLTDYGQKLDLTREETVALRALSLTFSDRCVLKDRKAVEDIHDKQFKVFQYVASKRHPNFNKWLPDVINFLIYLREFGIEFDKKSCKMNMEWPVIQRNPLLLEVFFS